MNLPKIIYFLGIGGIGMSALARYFHQRGAKVFGYDRNTTDLTNQMIHEGISIHYTDSPELIPERVEMVVYTPAIPKDLAEFVYLSQWPDKLKKRSEVLGLLTSNYKNIAVAGTHGKTTTSVLMAQLLDHCRVPFTGFLGGISKNHFSNLIDRGDDWMLEEADEFDRSFLQLSPNIAVIGSLDADHLDIYGDRMTMLNSYLQFVDKIKPGGRLYMYHGIAPSELETFRKRCGDKVQFLTYGTQSNADVRVLVKETKNGWMYFDFMDETGFEIRNIQLRLPGNHNASNAAVAIRVVKDVTERMDFFEEDVKIALQQFKGIDRRFDWKYESPQNVLIEDYAHHPTELEAAIKAARECYPGRKLTGIFQPHLYTRTRDFASDFARVLSTLDEIILVELYPARENPIEGIDSWSILNQIENKAKHFIAKSELAARIALMETDVILVLGAGDLDLYTEEIIKKLK
ncbi:MAG: UDP-N-acetylmuramate--L-alanine ligase [Saprospiraceae bacterium]|nr:UDP-N-acetylmuramate--L-alanine ligase [Saprospiraceae bacterium]